MSTAGGTFIDNQGRLELGTALGGASNVLKFGGSLLVSASSPVILNKSIEAGGNITIIVKDNGNNPDPADPTDNGDSIVVPTLDMFGQAFSLTAAGTIRLLAGADIRVQAGALLRAGSAINLEGDYQGGLNGEFTGQANVDPGVGSHISVAGTLDAPFVSILGERDPDVITFTGKILNGPNGSTYVSGSDGDDIITLWGTIGGNSTVLDGGYGDDIISLNADNAAGNHLSLTGSVSIFGGAGADAILLNKLDSLDVQHKYAVGGAGPTSLVTGLELFPSRQTINVNGGTGSDVVTVNTTGTADYIVNVSSNGPTTEGALRLVINGTGADDTFLMRDRSVMAMQPAGGGFGSAFERINYDTTVGVLQVNGLGGNNSFYVDGNSAITEIDGGNGNNRFQFGQLFGTDRTGGISVAAMDTMPTSLTDQGYVTRGIRYATTVLSGAGSDTFDVYASAAALSLSGGDGKDTFRLIPFVASGSGKLTIGEVAIYGGDGDDHVAYGIGVPVSIFGGAGKNSVEALGTEGDDVFVVTRDGIFSAGRSTTMIDVQAVEIDGLFGNDQFDVISTASDVVTTLIGGGGSDTFNVGGDVATPVIARKVDGQTAFLNYGITSTDPAYSNLGVDGTRLTLAVPQSGPVQVTQPSGGVTVLKGATNGTDVATYSLRMTQPNIGVTAYVTIFAAMPPGSSVARGAKSVEVSTDGVHFGQSIVVAFDGFSAPGSDTAWDRVQTIYVRAPRDSLLDGDQSALISHSIRTGNETVDARHIANVAVNVIDTRVPGVIVTVPDGGLRLAQNGVRSMVYDLALTRAPAAGETVRLKLNADPDLVSFSVVDHDQASRFKRNLNAITFDASNWNTPISVRVTAARDAPLPALTTLDIVQTLSSSRANGVYGNVSATTRVPVTIANSLTSGAGLLVLPKDPTAEVSVGTQTGYTVTLTKAPTAPVYVSLLTDGTTILTADPRGKQSNRFSLAPDGTAVVRFDSSNWNVPLSVNVAAKPGYVTSLPAPVQRVGASPHSTALIQGQLIIEGLGLPNRDHALRQGVMLPTETDTRPAILDVAAFAATQTVTLNVFNDGSNKDDIGVLGLATATSGLAALYGQAMNTLDIATFGSITGLGMASGGIVYHNVQIVDVMLGTGDDTFTVNDTVAGSVTVVQGGGGSNRLIANGGGGADAPLVLFGGTSQDGSFYSSSPRQVDGHARTFTNPGDNIIDARNATKSVVMYGGVGRDTIYGGRGDDWIAGGSGANTLDGRGGNDIILGASGFNIDLSERLSRSAQMLKIANAGSQTDNRITGDKLSAGSNRISGGTGNNIVFGDYGVVVQEAGVQSIKSTTGVVLARTTRPSNGADNVIDVGDGNNVVFGALFDDVITAGNGRNILLGEFGTVHYVDGIVDLVTAIHAGSGGKNQITSGQGKNTVIGGAGVDTIITGGGDNVVLADEGAVTYRGGVVVSVNASNPAFGGEDRITAGNGNNVVVGGNGMDKISAGNGDNVLFGDSGRVSYTKGVLTYAGTVGVGHGGNDAITMGNGSNIVVGGVGADSITGGDGKNRITGDDGSMGFVDGALAYVSTRNESHGGDDNITVGAGDNVGFGGMGSDTIQAGGGKNILFGDVGALQYRQSVLVSVESHYAGSDGDNQITVGNGKNVIVGGVRSDTIVAGDGGNVILGDHGEATYSAGVLTALKTQDPLSGGDDVIKSGSGVDVILGGAGSDRIDGGNGNNIVLGDHGMVRFDPSSKTASTIAGISLGLNGNNKITVGTGDSVIIGGTGTNAITGGDGHHIVFGAEGLVRLAAGKMTSAVSTTQFGGGDNVIKVGSGGSKVFGGAGNSAITAGDGDNIIIGHNGEITTVGGQLRSVRTTYAQAGDMSGITIQAGDGENLILGGSGGTTITVGDGNNRIAGANAEMLFANGKLKTFRSVDPNYHGSSHINAGGGSNTILGGGGADTIVAGDGKNIVIGDNGIVLSSASGSPTLIMSIDPSYAGDDQITVGSGDSVIMGGSGANTITVGDGDDLVFGGGGKVQYETGKLVDARTIDPSFAGNATITAGSGDSMIFGGSGFNKITIGAGNNKIIGANGLAQFADGKIS